MTRVMQSRHYSGTVDLDLCFPCQSIWFDASENMQISPGGIIELFKLIHAHRDEPRRQHPATMHCPRCSARLFASYDFVRSGRISYHRCPDCHGRFTAFAHFLIEKGFVRQLSPVEITALAARIGMFHCTGCGAPVDIRTEAACSHCGSPISILDPDAVEHALANYRKRERPPAPLSPEALANAIASAELARNRVQAHKHGMPVGDLLMWGVGTTLNRVLCDDNAGDQVAARNPPN